MIRLAVRILLDFRGRKLPHFYVEVRMITKTGIAAFVFACFSAIVCLGAPAPMALRTVDEYTGSTPIVSQPTIAHTQTAAEPTPAEEKKSDCNKCESSCNSCARWFPRRTITRTRTVTTNDACGKECSQTSTYTRSRGRLFPIFGRCCVSSCSSCNSCK